MTIVLAIVLFLAGALLIPGRPFWLLLYLVGGVYLFTRLSLEWSLRRLKVQRTLSDDHVFLGETVTVTHRFANESAMPLTWMQFSEARPNPLAVDLFSGVLSLGAGERVERSYTLTGTKRGRYTIGPLAVSGGDPFGFFRFGGPQIADARITVYPHISPLPELGLPARLPMGDLAARRRLFEDPAWLAGTRPYAPGDSLKRIHWNATARTGELVVKQFRHAMLLPCCVAVNLNGNEFELRHFWSQTELAVGAAASLSHYLVAQKQQVALLATGVDPEAGPAAEAAAPIRLPLRHGTEAMMGILEVLARIQAAPTVPFDRTLLEAARELPWGTLICAITPQETPELAAAAATLGRGGYQVQLFVMDGAPGRRTGYEVFVLSQSRMGEVALS